MKLQRVYLERMVFDTIYSDNRNTPHFEYKINFDDGTITLDLFTYNPLQNQVHFLHSVTKDTPVDCLSEMILYLGEHGKSKIENKPYTVEWSKIDDTLSETHLSYYYEKDENTVRNKFLKGKNSSEYLFKIILNPLS